MSRTRRAVTVLALAFLAYGVLVATNGGEFWPFSIYPMFSQGGKPWSRAVVLASDSGPNRWDTLGVDDLPESVFALADHGIDAIDLSNFVSKTRKWDAERTAGLGKMFSGVGNADRPLVVYRANGRLVDGSVRLEFVPYAVLDSSNVQLNPVLIP